MASTTFIRSYPRADFLALPGSIPLPLLRAVLGAVPQTVSIIDVRLTPQQDGAVVEWLGRPATADVQAIDDAIAAFAGGATTSEPFELESLASTNAPSDGSLATVIDFTTPSLDGGTYQVLWAALVGMLATVANTGVRGLITLTRMNADGSGAVTRSWEHNWTMQQPQTFSGGITFKCQTGQKIRARLQVQKLGVAAATAQIGGSRITIDQISAAA